MCGPPKIGHMKKPLKSPKIMQNYLKTAFGFGLFLDQTNWRMQKRGIFGALQN
jgi:hypothetical protein